MRERLLLGDGGEVSELRAVERACGRAKQRRGRVIRLLDGAVAIEHAVRERRVLEQVRKARARDLGAFVSLAQDAQLLGELRVLLFERLDASCAAGSRFGLRGRER